MEIERKFLLAQLPPDLGGARSSDIAQGYLAIDPDGTEVRVRRRDGRAVLTVKGPADAGGRSRAEEELALEPERFERLWPLTAGRRVEKTRHVLAAGGGAEIELDVYGGDLAGLAVAEVEFPDEDAAQAFVPPAWFGREVTDDARYKNQRLACDGAPPDAPRIAPS